MIFYYIQKKIKALFNLLGRKLLISAFSSHGKKTRFFPWRSDIHYNNISVGDDVYIGPNAMFIAANKKINIGNKVLFGPGVTIATGDHNFKKIGTFILDNRTPDPEDDQEVHIEDDVWVGANSTILKGVTIGRGSIIAAGSLVTKNVKPYCIYGGVPAKFLKNRFSFEDTLEHEKNIYNQKDRLTQIELQHLKE